MIGNTMGLDIRQRLEILSDDAKYDLSCSCGSDERSRRRRGLDGTWLYPVQLASGGTGVMLKTLLSNVCTSDCAYCPLRHNGASNRCSLTPDEIAKVFMDHLSRQWLLGIFLSSGIVGTPDHTMELLVAAAEILRRKYQYRGYIHLKIIPGASPAAIRRALQLSSAVSLNIEVPGAAYFAQLSNYKRFDTDIVAPLKLMAEHTAKGAEFARVKCKTQFIVGAATERDRDIVRYTGAIYDRLKFQRVYFSAYQPPRPTEFTLDDGRNAARLTREHRLYQMDFLLRKYKFKADEIVFDDTGDLDPAVDPKQRWADLHPEFYPVKVNEADREALLRIPGVGPVHVNRILKQRRERRLQSWLDIGLKGRNALKPLRYAVFS
ncbi:MAG: radical SAM protein [Kiritimatiellia bacterium]|jgi:predicted DNA-binding helix-hairpin-helix protein